MAKPEYAIREVSLAEVILFLLSAIIDPMSRKSTN